MKWSKIIEVPYIEGLRIPKYWISQEEIEILASTFKSMNERSTSRKSGFEMSETLLIINLFSEFVDPPHI